MSIERKSATGLRDHRGAIVYLPWLICLVTVTLALLTPLFAALNGATFSEFISQYDAPQMVIGIAFPLVGALIASRRPQNFIGWIFCLAGFFQALSVFSYPYAIYALLTVPGSLPGGAEMVWVSNWIWAPGLGLLLTFLPLLFPDGRLPSRRWRWVAWLGAVPIVFVFVEAVLFLWPIRGPALLADLDSTLNVEPIHEVLRYLMFPTMLVSALAAVVSLFVRFRRARGDERQQVKWFAYAGALTLTSVFVGEVFGLYGSWIVLVAPSLPVAAAVAILKYRLYDIDLIINRTLVYGSLSGALALVYWGSVVGLQTLFRPILGQGNDLAIVVSTLLIAALFMPLRARIQAFIDRRFYRRKYDAAKTLHAFSATVRDEVELDRLTGRLVEVVEETMQPAHVSLWLSAASGSRNESTQREVV